MISLYKGDRIIMSYPPEKIDYSLLPKEIAKTLEQDGGSGKTSVTFWGTNSMIINEDDTTIMIDPYFSRSKYNYIDIRRIHDTSDHLLPDPQRISCCLDKINVRCPAAIVCTHCHFDHILDLPGIVSYYNNKNVHPNIYGSKSALNVLLGKLASAETLEELYKLTGNQKEKYYQKLSDDFNFKIINSKDTIEINASKLTFIEGTHVHIPIVNSILQGNIDEPLTNPKNIYDYKQGQMFKILMESVYSGKTLFMGSAGYKDNEFNDYVSKYGSPDNLIVAVAGLYSHIETNNFVDNIITPLKAKMVRYTHWDDFDRTLDEKVNWAMATNPELVLRKISSSRLLPLLKKICLPDVC
jgi:hypothetical protein